MKRVLMPIGILLGSIVITVVLIRNPTRVSESAPEIIPISAQICEKAGAAGIVFHLRGDRRHIMDHDLPELKESVQGVLDFEMAATEEMIELLHQVQPDICTL